jgi:hypothetical protein
LEINRKDEKQPNWLLIYFFSFFHLFIDLAT